MYGSAHTSVQAGRIGHVTVHPPQPNQWKKLLVVVLLVVLPLGGIAAGVAVWLDANRRDFGSPGDTTWTAQSDSTPPGIPDSPETEESAATTSKTIPVATPPTAAPVAKYRVEGPVLEGGFTFGMHQSYDLDLDRQAYPSEGADLGLSAAELYAPASGALMVLKGDQVADCLDQPAKQSVAVERLPAVLCAVTDQGGLAVVHPKLVSGPLEQSPRVSITFELYTVSR
jgi:hypothetical protein